MTIAVPILPSSDVDRSLAWWGLLGFVEDFRHQAVPGHPRFLGMRRDEGWVYLTEHAGDVTQPGLIYLWVDDVDAVAAVLGVSDIDEMPWARDFEVSDPDGNRVRVATRRVTD